MIGIDIESVARIEHLIQKKPAVIKKFFTEYEWEYAQAKAAMAQTLTGIWCAKEAVVKAFSSLEPVFITDVEIRHSSSGAPYVCDIANQILMQNYEIQVSISHTKEYATAMAMISIKK